jgi:hypothetical protein
LRLKKEKTVEHTFHLKARWKHMITASNTKVKEFQLPKVRKEMPQRKYLSISQWMSIGD